MSAKSCEYLLRYSEATNTCQANDTPVTLLNSFLLLTAASDCALTYLAAPISPNQSFSSTLLHYLHNTLLAFLPSIPVLSSQAKITNSSTQLNPDRMALRAIHPSNPRFRGQRNGTLTNQKTKREPRSTLTDQRVTQQDSSQPGPN